MKKIMLSLLSYTLATMSGLCLVEGVTDMEGIANFISMLDYVLDTKRKRHITGGLLLSGALLFGGLAMTVMSIRDDEEDEDE